MVNRIFTKLLELKTELGSRKSLTSGFNKNRIQNQRTLPGIKTVGLPMAFLLMLSGCQTPAIKPPPQKLQQIGKILVVPVESPPLEVIPDLIASRLPVYTQYQYETVPTSLLMTQKLYRNPGGILISGMVGGNDPVDAIDYKIKKSKENTATLEPSTDLMDYWSPSQVLAQDAAKQLTRDGIKAIPSEYYYRLPISNGDHPVQHGTWHDAIKQWYNLDRSPIDYNQPGLNQIDAVLEIGVSSYGIFQNQTSLKVLVKLIDPATREVIGRTSSDAYSAEDTAQSLLSQKSERFKLLIKGLGEQLVARGLSDLELPFRQSSHIEPEVQFVDD